MELVVVSLLDLDKVADFILATNFKHITFTGEMGSGKTTLIQVISKKLNVKDNVTSPTYSLVNQYQTNLNNIIYHFDLFRVKTLKELQNIGVEHYLQSNAYCMIEWPELINDLLDTHLKVNFVVNNNERIISLNKIYFG